MQYSFSALSVAWVRRIVRLIATGVMALIFSSCSNDSMTIFAEFANTQDIETGTKVMFEGQQIGEVADTDIENSGSKITLNLDITAANKLSSNSAVVVNRLKEGAPLEIYNRNSAASVNLVEGQSIRGLDSMLQLGAWMVGDVIQLGSSALNEYVAAFQGYLDSEEFQNDKAAVKLQLEDVKSQASEALKELEIELDSAADDLAANEQAAARAMDELGREMAPVIADLSGDGAKLAKELHRFAESIESSSMAEQQAGEAFLASLLTTLERLNQALDDGVEQAEDEAEETQRSTE